MKKSTIFWSILSVMLLAYGLWPLSDSSFLIEHDPEKEAFRTNFLAQASLPPIPEEKPNIVLLLADDLGKTDISIYGSPHLQTPHIDQIGKEGVIFTQGYITSPICSPSRAALMTGRYQQRFGFEIQPHLRYPRNRLELFVFKYLMPTGDWLVADQSRFPTKKAMHQQGLPPSEFTLAELLRLEGYKNYAIGKWHLGYALDALPLARGFDYHYGFYEAFTLYDDPGNPNIINQKHDNFSDPYIWKKGRSGTCAIRRNDTIVEEDVFLTDKLVEEAVQVIANNKNNPFFLYVPFLTPHTPFQVPKKYFEQFPEVKDRNKRVYYAMIKSLDDAVGQIMDALEEQGLKENTIVIFLSDNGGATYTKATDNAPLKGGKFTQFEGGVNIPFLMRWPAKIPIGKIIEQPASSLDVFATTTKAAGCYLPEDRIFDGKDLMPFIRADSSKTIHEALYWRSNTLRAIRKGEWKLIEDRMSDNIVLYNLETDPFERTNLKENHPSQVKALIEELNSWEQNLKPPLWPRVMDFRYRDEHGDFFFPL